MTGARRGSRNQVYVGKKKKSEQYGCISKWVDVCMYACICSRFGCAYREYALPLHTYISRQFFIYKIFGLAGISGSSVLSLCRIRELLAGQYTQVVDSGHRA